MQFQFDVTPTSATVPAPKPAESPQDILRQLVEIQREQLQQLRNLSAALDHGARWRTLMNRWREEFPELPEDARHALPILEKAYGAVLAGLVEELRDKGPDGLDNDFSVQEFLDRYGMRLGQLSHILNIIAPLAEQNAPKESS